MRVALGLIIKDKKVLVVKRKDSNLYSLPGGKVDLGESTLSGLKREVLEETGLIILGKPVIIYVDTVQKYLVKTYKIDKYSGDLVDKENINPHWATPEEFKNNLSFPEYNNNILKFIL